mmetsp:Transcript_7054/g.14136  ORF Transcript_7054/g.14136 Transcript_7054/m.14136 type:complete len:195 (+) Transcript_7054:113-697(+)
MVPLKPRVLGFVIFVLHSLVPCWSFSCSLVSLNCRTNSVFSRPVMRRPGKGGLGALNMIDNNARSRKQMRDDALGFLAGETDATESLEAQLRTAMREAEAAEAKAEQLRAEFSASKKGQQVPQTNGLSAMLDPMANAMLQEQSDYMRQCPVTEILESLEETRCGVMQAFSVLRPSTILGAALIMYAISVLQLSQ